MANEYHLWLTRFTLYRRFVDFTKQVHVGTKGITLYMILYNFFKQLFEDDVDSKASGVAFKFTMAIFPAILFLFTLIPYIPVADLQSDILEFLADFMPASIYEATELTILDIVGTERASLLSFGFFFALILATNGVVGMMDAFNKSQHTTEKRSYLHIRFIAVVMVFVFAFVLLLAVTLLIVGGSVLDYLLSRHLVVEDFVYYLILMLRYIVLFIFFFLAISFIYYLAPSVNRRWKFLSVGALLASLLVIFVSSGFSYYIQSFGTYNKLYGSIGTMLGIMLWFYLISWVLILGFELNVSMERASRDVRKAQAATKVIGRVAQN